MASSVHTLLKSTGADSEIIDSNSLFGHAVGAAPYPRVPVP